MSSRALIVSGLVIGLVSLVALSGCASETAGEKVGIGSSEAELRLATPRYLGTIASGETKASDYYRPPRFRAFGFTAKPGDDITVDVKSTYGDAMGWITTSTYDVLAANDDASSSTLDAKVTYKVPSNGTGSGAAATPRNYRIVFRDYDLLDATFTVKLSIASAPEPTTCSYGGQTYQSGASFPSTDGCNTCSCGDGGSVGCTKRACVCNPEAEPWRRYLGTPTTCMTIRYACGTNERSFQNACGCGCEQTVH